MNTYELIGRFKALLKFSLYKMTYRNRISVSLLRNNICFSTIVKCYKYGRIKIGDIVACSNVHLESNNGNLEIGKKVFINHNTIIACHKNIQIGDGCFLGPNVCIYDHDHIFDSNGPTGSFRCSDIIIEENCWIGAGVIILRGTHIGKNSVVGAGAIVKGNIPPYSLIKANRDYSAKTLKDYSREQLQ